MRRVRRRPLPRPARNRKPTFTCKNVAKTRLRPTSLCQQAARCAQYSAPTTQCREQEWSFAPDGKCSRRNSGGAPIALPHPALPAPAQKASSPSVARTCACTRGHGRTIARTCVCTHSRTRICVHTCTHIRAAATAAPSPAPAPNVARICTCSRTHIRAAATAAKGPRCPLYRRTHLRKIATGREVKFNFLRIWPLLAKNPRS